MTLRWIRTCRISMCCYVGYCIPSDTIKTAESSAQLNSTVLLSPIFTCKGGLPPDRMRSSDAQRISECWKHHRQNVTNINSWHFFASHRDEWIQVPTPLRVWVASKEPRFWCTFYWNAKHSNSFASQPPRQYLLQQQLKYNAQCALHLLFSKQNDNVISVC